MTITAKDGPSTSDSKAPFNSSAEIEQTDGSPAQAPPSYAETLGNSTSGPGTGAPPAGLAIPEVPLPTPLPRATNYHAEKTNREIKGVYVLDTAMQIPPAILANMSSGFFGLGKKEPENLNLYTSYGPIEADLILLSRINAQPVKVKAKSGYGNMTVYLPRDFNGPLKYKTGWGTVTFSEGMRPFVHQFSGNMGYLGDWNVAGFSDYKTWNGDELEVVTQGGNITFKWADELMQREAGSPEEKFHEAITYAMQSVMSWFGGRK
ncbi:SubName: Full=Uncharacterized protein {ECO:0000313/EMBL:CCA72045.1} [Serendipita indica DSM 11827]|nr:SubName: Full=Uncharacterized protein {ECO:0000313/EMBL:CCA72045.1} [Serendipita indica DSM 11827]